eukprot:13693739-Ditylum_brightwellii.AAC.1
MEMADQDNAHCTYRRSMTGHNRRFGSGCKGDTCNRTVIKPAMSLQNKCGFHGGEFFDGYNGWVGRMNGAQVGLRGGFGMLIGGSGGGAAVEEFVATIGAIAAASV